MNYEINVLVNGRRIKQFRQQGKVYIEGRRGSEYELEIKNNTQHRVLAVPSVDGLSVMDGKAADPRSSNGYVLAPWSSIRIPGWRLDDSEVAAFTFGNRRHAYASSKGAAAKKNIGIIGCAIFRENYTIKFDWDPIKYNWDPNVAPCPHRPWTITDRTVTTHLPGDSWSVDNSPIMGSTSDSIKAHCGGGGTTTSLNCNADAGEPGTLNIGTEFGDRADHAVFSTHFDRQSTATVMMEIIYSDRPGLERMGVNLRRSSRRYEAPSAFPAAGCAPPAGWNG